MELCGKKKKKTKYISYFTFLKVVSGYLDVSFAHYCHNVNQLYEVVTWNTF